MFQFTASDVLSAIWPFLILIGAMVTIGLIIWRKGAKIEKFLIAGSPQAIFVLDAAFLLTGLVTAWNGWLFVAVFISFIYWSYRLNFIERAAELNQIHFYPNPQWRAILLDYATVTFVIATGPIYHWLGPTTEAKLFVGLVLLCALWIMVMLRRKANPLAEAVGSTDRSSLAGVIGIIGLVATLLPVALNARNSLQPPHSPPELPSQLVGYAATSDSGLSRYLEPLWLMAGGGSIYGSQSGPLYFAVITWKDTATYSYTENYKLGAQMLEGIRDIRIGYYSCAYGWTGRAGSYVFDQIAGSYEFLSMFGINLRSIYGPSEPIFTALHDTSPQGKFFWHLGPAPPYEVSPPMSVGCGAYRHGIDILVIFFDTASGGVPPSPLAVTQVVNEISNYYGLQG